MAIIRTILILPILVPLTMAVFTSMYDMEQLAKREEQFIKLLNEYINKSETRLNQLKKIHRRLLDVQEIIAADGDGHLDNPINGFLLIMRATTEWKQIEQLINQQKSDLFPDILNGLLTEDGETFVDINFIRSGASEAIIRLQTVYNFSSTDLANNDIFTDKYNHVFKDYRPPVVPRIGMSARNCYYIAVECLKSDDHGRAIEWFNISLDKLKQDKSINEVHVLNGLETSLFKSGRIKDALDVQSRLLELVSMTELIAAERIAYRTLIKNNLTTEDELFYKLCREGDQRSVAEKSRLKCYHLDRNPYIKLFRFKVEEAHINPDILTVHNFYSDKEMATLQTDSVCDMEYFQQLFYNQEQSLSKSIKTVVRHSKQWDIGKCGDDADHSIAKSVTKRMELVTGLNTNQSFHVFVYGLGGHQDQHFDSRVSNVVNASTIEDFSSRQLATANGFISDVDNGGATTFIYLGVAIKPVKGSVIFWYNLNRHGYADPRMRHGACPMLQGTKWTVLNSFYIGGNELNQPCPK